VAFQNRLLHEGSTVIAIILPSPANSITCHHVGLCVSVLCAILGSLMNPHKLFFQLRWHVAEFARISAVWETPDRCSARMTLRSESLGDFRYT
jgi:hypothetical protein